MLGVDAQSVLGGKPLVMGLLHGVVCRHEKGSRCRYHNFRAQKSRGHQSVDLGASEPCKRRYFRLKECMDYLEFDRVTASLRQSLRANGHYMPSM
jgi:hypothetical protein